MKISAVSGGGGGGERKEQSVVEQLIFLRIDPEQVEPEDARECVENIWSLQYQTAGVVCSSAGASLEEKIGSGLLGSPKGLGYFTHAVHFRFPGRDQMDTFVQSPVVQKVFAKEFTSSCADRAALSFVSSIPEDLFAIFRKGQDWDEGFDHLMVIRCDTTGEATARVAGMRKQVEEHQPRMEEYGIQQLTFGVAIENEKQIGVLMRFRNEYDFDYFTKSILYANFIGSSSVNSMSIVTYGVGSQQESRHL
ncbi:hypothetical protein A3770_02p11350 [Chloropicon primus]|uniref:Stress-response A/B barrel domain-containing protein n=1 Tax=Chloropicon primus TaxID=1764295 RepID=A0A5B8ME05_9CHLO|nr:hypothetical protein A3770_02p11350 [Chloropicon primus]|eukprot:QDZ18617.1 hypothetical protein A3770_02p11350 [Chloropicon primus]